MKILYIHNTTIDSSQANLLQVLSMCNSFSDNNASVTLLLPSSDIEIINIKEYVFKKHGINVNFDMIFFEKNFLHPSIDKYLVSKKVRSVIKTSDADYIFSRLPLFIMASLKENKKVIYESHSNKLHDKYRLIDYIWRLLLVSKSKNKNFQLFITISNNLLNFWELMGISSMKLLALHDGARLESYNLHDDKKTIRRHLGLPIDKKIFVYTGSLYPDREIENILRLAKRLPQYFFCVVGGPDKNKDHYVNISSKMNLKNIMFTGYLSHSLVPKYLKSADVLLALWSNKVPTINYCSPLKVFEYMASGTTIVAHSFPTIKEVLVHRANAFLVNYGDFDDLVKQSEIALTDNSCGELARKNAKNFSWDVRVKKIMDAIS